MSNHALWRGIRGAVGFSAALVGVVSLGYWAVGDTSAFYLFVVSFALSFALLAR